MRHGTAIALAITAMASIIIASNFLVQQPVVGTLGPIDLSSLLTYGAFTYPLAFLITDITNRMFGPAAARKVVFAGFAIAVVTPIALVQIADLPPSTTRVVLASATAFLVAQLIDISIFHRLRLSAWWRAPLTSSLFGSALDTAIFFTLAFSAMIAFQVDGFATSTAPLLGVEGMAEAPRWVSWAIGDFAVKLLVAVAALIPFRMITLALAPAGRA